METGVAGGLGIFEQHVVCASGQGARGKAEGERAQTSSDIFHGGKNGAVLRENTQDRPRYIASSKRFLNSPSSP